MTDHKKRKNIIDQPTLGTDSSRIRYLLLGYTLSCDPKRAESHNLLSTLEKLGGGELIYEKGSWVGGTDIAAPVF